MRRAAKVDANQSEIVQALRKLGVSVYPTHMVGRGFPDLVVGHKGMNFLIELKDGNKPKSKKALTADEQVFFDTWKGSVFIVESIEDCLEIVK